MNALFLLGRILFGAIFFMSGLTSHLLGMKGAVGYAKSMGAPLPELLVPLSGLVLVVGALMLWLGIKPKIAAWLLFLFLVCITPIMHRFWGVADPQMAMFQQVNFMKNLALIGATLMFQMIDKWPLSLKP